MSAIWSSLQKFLGFEPDESFEPEVSEEQTEDVKSPRPGSTKTPGNNIVGFPTAPQSEMVVLEPRSFDDALPIIDNLRTRRAVILNLQGLTTEQSQRLVDFVSGACHALDGHQERIGEAIFLFTPSNVKINALSHDTQWMVAQVQAPAAAASNDKLFWRVR